MHSAGIKSSIMEQINQESRTLVIEPLKDVGVFLVQQRVLEQTKGLLVNPFAVANDRLPEFSGAKIMYVRYHNPQCAAKAAEVMMGECKRNRWGGGCSRATTKDRMNVFPLHVSGFVQGHARRVAKRRQQQRGSDGITADRRGGEENGADEGSGQGGGEAEGREGVERARGGVAKAVTTAVKEGVQHAEHPGSRGIRAVAEAAGKLRECGAQAAGESTQRKCERANREAGTGD